MSERVKEASYTNPDNQEVLEPFELPPIDVVCKGIFDALQPLREDEAVRERFYGEMGVVRTRLKQGELLSTQKVWYKDEREQPSGTYKSRGASYAVMQQPAERYVTWSTGNNAISVGIAAARAGAMAEVEGTTSMSSAKVEKVERTGATLRQRNTFRQAELAALSREGEPGTVVVPPFGSPEVVAGQCSLGDEVVVDLVERGLTDHDVTIPVSVGGGGHIAGVALAVWQAKQAGLIGPRVRVVAVQPEKNDTMRRALLKVENGLEPTHLYPYVNQDKACDALAIGEASLSPDMMAIIGNPELVSCFYTVSEAEIGRSMAQLETELGGNIEPAAALGHAFARDYAAALRKKRLQTTFVVPVSGGNVSAETKKHYQAAVARDDFRRQSEAYAGRKLAVREEIAVLKKAETEAKDKEPYAVRELAYAALSGYTARYRTGLVVPRPM